MRCLQPTLLAGCALIMVLSGCTTPAVHGAPETGTAPVAATPAVTTDVLDVDETAAYIVGACVPDSLSSCRGAGLQQTTQFVVAHADTVAWTGVLDVTWSTPNPFLQELTVVVLPARSCGPSCFEGHGNLSVTGSSPLHIDVAIPDTGEYRDGLAIAIIDKPWSDPVWLDVETPTDVRVHGTLVATSAAQS